MHSQTAACLGGDALEDVVQERVHDGHRLAGYTNVGMNLFQDLIDVGAIGFLPPALGDRLLGLSVLLARLSGGPKFRNFIGRFLLKSNNQKTHK